MHGIVTEQQRHRLAVPAAATGSRLDRFLTGHLTGYSRAQVQRLIDAGLVHIDGVPAKAKTVVHAGQWIEYTLPPPVTALPHVAPQPIPLEILYEDDALVVINKPAGLVVHPGAGRRDGTLVNALLARYGALSAGSAPDRPGIVHRLDAGTTGVIVVARNDLAHHALARQFADRVVEKTYLALCYGALHGNGSIDRPIGRHPTDRQRMSTRARRGRMALTHWRVREAFGRDLTLLEITLATGRTHQIRVHCAAIGHPLVGDPVYGGSHTYRGLPEERQFAVRAFTRPALHAWRLRVQHPVTGAAAEWTAPLADDFERLLQQLRRGDKGNARQTTA